ncbi:FKBP-type peptidyl-prolyl cis-trans isomerase [Cellulomonas edaphi]|uniref:peptidylprolyl isomerase n=1 Tax=Cellulomonas edaphi TaxID=3053468 RepID=A0ABT7S5J7_9CELL|nr:FKBP-type peptidyl-prolyl cis-trans isomerase [Cellulomons edaphi]MDM7830254.1 FKBP-type peptidyl-prolyl cis-trans isomerase [Cellulomons edaphi]
MRRTTRARGLAAGALALTLAATLAACGTDSGDDNAASKPSASASSPAPTTTAAPTASAADVALVRQIKVVGEAGKEPKVTLPKTPFAVGGIVVNLLEDGTGAAIKDGQQLSMQIAVISGDDGKVLQSSYTSSPQLFTAGATQIPDLDKALEGTHVGSRLILAAPSNPQATAAPSTQVFAIEVIDAKDIPTRAEGTAVAPKDGLPVVTLDGSGKPAITASKADKPTTLVAQPLIKGKGEKVKAGQTVTVKYSGWTWDGKPFDSSWERDPSTFDVTNIGQAQVIAGWNEGLVGQTVGSQVLLVVPPDKGYGDSANGEIPASSTLVFVVDILSAT